MMIEHYTHQTKIFKNELYSENSLNSVSDLCHVKVKWHNSLLTKDLLEYVSMPLLLLSQQTCL